MKAANSNFSLRGIAFFTSVVFLLSLCCFHSGILAADVSEVYEEEFEVVVSERASGDELKLAKRFYAGLGLFYGFPSDLDDVTVTAYDVPMAGWTYQCPTPLETESGIGLNVKGGYFFSENFALEMLFRYHFKYKIDGKYSRTRVFSDAISYISADADGDMKGWDITINPKYFPFGDGIMEGQLRPYLVGGLGYMSGKIEGDILASVMTFYGSDIYYRGTPYSESDTKSGLCGRIGAGCDWFFTNQFAVELELDYTMGFGDVDEINILIVGLNGLVAF